MWLQPPVMFSVRTGFQELAAATGFMLFFRRRSLLASALVPLRENRQEETLLSFFNFSAVVKPEKLAKAIETIGGYTGHISILKVSVLSLSLTFWKQLCCRPAADGSELRIWGFSSMPNVKAQNKCVIPEMC